MNEDVEIRMFESVLELGVRIIRRNNKKKQKHNNIEHIRKMTKRRTIITNINMEKYEKYETRTTHKQTIIKRNKHK